MTSRDESVQLGNSSPNAANIDEWAQLEGELTAALLADQPTAGGALPAALAERIVAVGEEMVRVPNAAPVLPMVTRPRRPSPRVVLWSGWLAAAATLLIWLFVPRPVSVGREVGTAVDAAVDAAWVAPNGASNRSTNGASNGASAIGATVDAAATRLAWTATSDASARGASGSVVWSGTAQTGAMRFAGLAPNDRARWQYQLWIFDKRRDQRYPVDGGVFDIPAGAAEVLVPIHARLPVGEATMFVVTVEPVGGVVVSSRERIALIAKTGI
jgi:hypothetical protein